MADVTLDDIERALGFKQDNNNDLFNPPPAAGGPQVAPAAQYLLPNGDPGPDAIPDSSYVNAIQPGTVISSYQGDTTLQNNTNTTSLFSFGTDILVDITIYIENAQSLTARSLAYTVLSGDSISSIATKFGCTGNAILALNSAVQDPNVISVGQVLQVPVGGSTNSITLNVVSWKQGRSLNLTLDSLNFLKKLSDYPIKEINAINNFGQVVTLFVSYTVKKYDPLKEKALEEGVTPVLGNVSILSAQTLGPIFSGTLTTSSGAGSKYIANNVYNYNSALVTVSGTYTGFSLQMFVSSDNGTHTQQAIFYNVSDWTGDNTSSPSDSTYRAYMVPIIGMNQLQVVCTAISTGTVNVSVQPTTNVFTETPLAGSNTAANSAPVTIASDNTAIPVTFRVSNTNKNFHATSFHITTKTTTTPVATTCWVRSITISCSNAGTAWTLTIQDKSGTPLILVNALTFATTTTPTILTWDDPIVMGSGVDMITGGTTAGVVDIWVNYYN